MTSCRSRAAAASSSRPPCSVAPHNRRQENTDMTDRRQKDSHRQMSQTDMMLHKSQHICTSNTRHILYTYVRHTPDQPSIMSNHLQLPPTSHLQPTTFNQSFSINHLRSTIFNQPIQSHSERCGAQVGDFSTILNKSKAKQNGAVSTHVGGDVDASLRFDVSNGIASFPEDIPHLRRQQKKQRERQS